MKKTLAMGCALLAAFFGFGCLGCIGEEQKMANIAAANKNIGGLPVSLGRPRISLDGEWALMCDPDHTKGQAEKWYQLAVKFPDVTQVPGCWHYKTGNNAPYNDVVWFKKTFQIPATWNKGRVWLNIGGVKPAADIWLNDAHVAFTHTSRSPIKMDISDYAKCGEENTLAMCVSWPEVRLDGDWDDGGQVMCWDGIYRSVFLEQTPDVWVDEIHVQTNVAKRAAQVNLVIGGGPHAAEAKSVRCRITPWQGKGPAYTGKGKLGPSTPEATNASVDVDMKDARLWSPDDPYLYVAQVSLLGDKGNVIDEASVRFGLREISRHGKQIFFNGRPIFLRGGCDFHTYPESFCPPNSKEFFLKRIKLAKEYGFNYTKSCVEVFTQEYLDAADEAGYLVCQEMPFGVNGKHRNIRYNPPPEFETLYREELAHIVRSDRNHPSVVIYSMSSEIWDDGFNQNSFRIFGQNLPRITRQLNPSALVIDCTGGFPPEIKTKFGERDTDLESLSEIGPCNELPYIFHEWNYWTSLPDPKVKARYQNLPAKPNGVLQMEAAAAKTGLTDELPIMVAASQKFKAVLRKTGLEYARKTPGTAGYHHFLIHDLNWCPEGVFNEFWDRPKDLPAEEFRMYNADTVILLKNGYSTYEHIRACYSSGEELESPILVSHYGAEPLAGAKLDWTVTLDGKTILQGHETAGEIACGTCVPMGAVKGKLPIVEKAGPLTIEAFLRKKDGSLINKNNWRFWIFPEGLPDLRGKGVTSNLPYIKNAFPGVGDFDPARNTEGTGLLVTDILTQDVLGHLEKGGKVLLLDQPAAERGGVTQSGLPDSGASLGHPWAYSFRSITYNAVEIGNMGTVIRAHPALADFPHEGWCDFQFYYLIEGFQPFTLEGLKPAKIHPIIRANGSYQKMQDKAYLFEAEVGTGKLMASSFGFARTFKDHPESRFLVGQLLKYCCSDRFAPSDKLAPEILKKFVRK